MIQLFTPWTLLLALALVSIAAVLDTWRGIIPNWLTLPPLLCLPLVHLLLGGPGAAAESFMGAALCFAVPAVLFYKGAMGGGDVKLFAALGALLPPMVALEVQWASFVAVAILALIELAMRGQLQETLRGTGQLALSALGRRPSPTSQTPHSVRMGLGILVATLFTLSSRAWP